MVCGCWVLALLIGMFILSWFVGGVNADFVLGCERVRVEYK